MTMRLLIPDVLAAAPVGTPKSDARSQLGDIFSESMAWFQAHWLQIALATAAAIFVYLLLNLVRGCRWSSARSDRASARENKSRGAAKRLHYG
jgi:hypothetical protein